MQLSLSKSRARAWLAATVAVLLAAPSTLAAQSIGSIRGRVVDEGTKHPLSSAQVTVENTRFGAMTSDEGTYTINNVPEGTYTVRVRRLGYRMSTQSVTVAAGQTATADFALQVATVDLDAVVVTGTPGAQSKRTIGNAITQLDVAALTEKATVNNVSEVLQAKTPGLTLLPGSGTAGTAAAIRIRGAGSSLTTSPNPVIYIDGVRMSDASLGNYNPSGSGTGGNFAQGTSALNLLNPDDIESIEVIKGPAAATLYGTDAANGVIQIITKKGSRGQAIAWSGRFEMGQTDWHIDPPTNYTTCDAAKVADATNWPGCQGQAVGTILTDNPLRRRDSQGNMPIRKGLYENFNVSARGGGDRFSYYVSGEKTDDYGVFWNNYDLRRAARANFAFTPTDKFDFAINTTYLQEHVRLPLGDDAAAGLIISAVRGSPGGIASNEPGYQILGPEQANRYDNQTRAERAIFGTTANYRPFDWFRNRVTVGVDYNNSLATIFYPPDASGKMDYSQGFTAQRMPLTHLYTFDYAGTISTRFLADYASDFSFGAQGSARQYRNVSATGLGLGSPATSTIGSAATTTGGSSYEDQNQLGFYAQEQVGWKDRLFVTGALRMDNNSAFGSKIQRIYYPKAMLSYIASEEPALKPLFDAIRADQFKFRFAWGQAGKAPGPFDAQRTYAVSVVTMPDGTTQSALRTSSPGNTSLKPERGVESEIGFDASFLNNRAGIEFTYYNKVMNDVIYAVPAAGSMGFVASQFQNLGQVKNAGTELSLSATPVQTERFAWDSRLTFATNANKLTRIGRDLQKISIGNIYYGTAQWHAVGYPLGGYWAQKPLYDANGALRLDARGNPMLDTLSYIGSSIPTREAGFSNTFTFGPFRLYGLLDYKGGAYLFNVKDWVRTYARNNSWEYNDPSISPERKLLLSQRASAVYFFIQPSDFVKLRDLSLSYTLPSRYTGMVGAGPATLTLAGHNLAVWSKYGGMDPEVNYLGAGTISSRQFERGDSYTTPMLRRVTMSLNVSF